MSILDRLNRPPAQAILLFGIGFFLMGAGWALHKTGIWVGEPLFAWTIAAALLLFFALFNSLLSLRADSALKYWGASVYSFLALAFCNGFAAQLFSGIPIGQAGSYRWIYVVVTFGFLVFLSMINFMKRIVNFAEKEEWNQPRRRK
jgi:hypothetical protein